MTGAGCRRLAAGALLALLLARPAVGQLYSDFSLDTGPDDGPANVYFGVARDDRGNYVSGATVVVATNWLDFVAVTDHRGRFRLEVPVDITPADVDARCSHAAYGDARVSRRLPRGGAATPVELRCELL